ncbi:MAG: hypothetical protein EOP49_24290 [Sphingobacteriales bacterium]|nr:MAG: hypothetical protein EOP49_24290 [Sphingobacteriales bacterium]
MKDDRNPVTPPGQEEGVQKNLVSEKECNSATEAEAFYEVARARLFDVNNWHKTTKGIKTVFQLVDKEGNPLSRTAREGDYVAIDIPGPGSDSGGGRDWVLVEGLEPEQKGEQRAGMRLRPVSNPTVAANNTAHFFSDHASSTFTIERDGNKVRARYHGRNEKPNTDASTIKEKVRNAVVAIGAMLGFSDIQWKGLIEGFLDPEE